MISCVVFDFDGTLADSNEIKRQSFFDIARRWDTSGEVVNYVLTQWPAANRYEKIRKIVEHLSKNKSTQPSSVSLEAWSASMASEYTALCEKALTGCAEMPAAKSALEKLFNQGLQLFVNSATPVAPLQKIIELRHLNHFFQAVYGAENSKFENLNLIAQATGAQPHEIVHVGDQIDDLRGAKEFGCHFIAITSKTSAPLLSKCTLKVKTLQDLPGMLSKLSREVL